MSKAITRILAATDFSPEASLALDRAADLARLHRAELRLVHALERGDWLQELGGAVGPAPALPDLRDAVATALARERDRLAIDNCCIEILDQALHRALPALLETLPADLLVMGGRGAGGWADLVLGSTADRVLRLHRLPVLLVRRAATGEYRRVASGTDFSAASEAAARFVIALCPQATRLLVHASEPTFESTLAFAGVSSEVRSDYRSAAARRAMIELEAFAQRLGPAGLSAVAALREGRASRELPAFVSESGVELMAVGVQGRSRIEVGLLGSVSRHLAASLPCDVLLVPLLEGSSDALPGRT
jgi:nucleotide-binding universal stress UspA family protein